MKTLVQIAVCFGFLSLSALSQTGYKEELIPLSDLRFNSDFEKQTFLDFIRGSENYIALTACIDPKTNEREVILYHDWIQEIVQEIKNKKFYERKEEKKIKIIKDHLDKAFFSQYEPNATFDDLFRFGYYNFITACVLYTLVLEELNLPYVIKEATTYLYVEAFPSTIKIPLKPPSKDYRYYIFDHDTRLRFVDYLKNIRVIDDQTFRSTSSKILFEENYFANEPITFRELIGLQYFNDAVKYMDQLNHEKAYFQLEKAYVLYPTCKIQFLLLVTLNAVLKNIDYTNQTELYFLVRASRYRSIGFKTEFLLIFFSDITNDLLYEKKNQDQYTQIFEFLFPLIDDKTIRKEITYIYHAEVGKVYHNSGKFALALDHLEKAFSLKPDDEETAGMFAKTLGGYAATIGPSQMIPIFEYYEEEYSGLDDIDLYVMIKLHAYLQFFGESFRLQDQDNGEKYLKMFEELHYNNPDIGIDYYLIGSSYSSASIYYYRIGDKARSKQVIEKGLELAPDNVELKMKLSSFQD